MIHIVGGTYREGCVTPFWSQLYGSGGRAAAALSALTDQITLHTYIGAEDQDLLQSMAATYGFTVVDMPIPHTLVFDYFHCLSVPVLTPPIGKVVQVNPLTVTENLILRFGILEGDAVVHGKWVVYDPQEPRNPQPFAANGSSAEHLAIVANYGEAAALSGQTQIAAIGRVLIADHGAEVVVIKRGVLGATIITSTMMTTVPVFRTERVWSIGSGDVFAAAFTYFWAYKHQDPLVAARAASLSTAFYCNTQTLPIPTTLFEKPPFEPVVVLLSPEQELVQHPQVYLAGPFFTMAQRWLVEEARTALLNSPLSVFSPLHDVGRGPADQVVQRDLEGLDRSATVLALLDGHDAGTLFEIGYARAKQIPVVAFAEQESVEDLKMFAGTNCQIVHDFVTAIYTTVWTALST
jgi:nucleoside 2-deoxyribosyltransferase